MATGPDKATPTTEPDPDSPRRPRGELALLIVVGVLALVVTAMAVLDWCGVITLPPFQAMPV